MKKRGFNGDFERVATYKHKIKTIYDLSRSQSQYNTMIREPEGKLIIGGLGRSNEYEAINYNNLWDCKVQMDSNMGYSFYFGGYFFINHTNIKKIYIYDASNMKPLVKRDC